MTNNNNDDLFLLALALLLVAGTLLVRGLIAAGALVAQLLDAIAGNDHQPPGGGTALPVVITAPTTAVPTISPSGLPLAALSVPQLRQLLRGSGIQGWWSFNRQQCLAALAGGAA